MSSFDEAIAYLVSRVPGFSETLAELEDFFGDNLGAHIVTGEFREYVTVLFLAHQEKGGGEAELKAAFDVVETFASSDVIAVQELSWASFLEQIGGQPELAAAMLPWMGPHSRRQMDELDRFWAKADAAAQAERATARLSRHHRPSKRLEAVDLLVDMPPDVAVPELRRMLGDCRDDTADAAAEALRMRVGLPGRSALMEALEDENEWARLAAARCLAREREPRALSVLERAMHAGDFAQRGPAIEGLCCYGITTQDLFEREMLKDDNPGFLREMAARALAQVAGSAAIPALTSAASNADEIVARAARASLNALDHDEPLRLIGWTLAELSEREQVLLRYVLVRHAPDLVAKVEESGLLGLSEPERSALQGAIADELIASGLRADDEPNAYGLELEDLLDAVLRVHVPREPPDSLNSETPT